MTSAMPEERSDVTVIGGGPTGSAVAIALESYGLSVTLLERSSYAQLRIGETFPPSIKRPLDELGLWEDFLTISHVESFGIRSIWGGPNVHDRSFMFDPYGSGWHVDRSEFDAVLARAAGRRGVRLRSDSRVKSYVLEGNNWWKLTIASPAGMSSIKTRLIVDATGRRSAVARRLGSLRIVHDHLIGVYGFLQTEQEAASQPFTLIESIEDGWWYSAPLPGGRRVAGFMTDSDLYASLKGRDVARWQTRLVHAPQTIRRVSHANFERPLQIFCANSSCLSQVYGPGWIAVGDAASAFDPLSGDGVVRALKSGIRAAKVIHLTLLGDDSAMKDYARTVKEEFRAYLQQRNAYYGQETRWRESPFWSRRHQQVKV